MKTKAGEELTPKAAAKLRKMSPHIFGRMTERDAWKVKSKSDTKTGQWICADCGEVFQNNMGAAFHEDERPKHRLVWWTGEQFEEP